MQYSLWFLVRVFVFTICCGSPQVQYSLWFLVRVFAVTMCCGSPQVQYSLWLLVRVFAVTIVLWLPSTAPPDRSCLNLHKDVYVTRPSPFMITSTKQLTVCYSQNVKFPYQLPFSMPFSLQRHPSACPIQHEEHQRPELCELNLPASAREGFWMNGQLVRASGWLFGMPASLEVGVSHWAANRWLETIV